MQLQIFKYEEENHLDNLTTVEIDGEVWFVASEVCKLLDIKNSSDAVSRLDDDEKLTSVLPIAGQNRSVLVHPIPIPNAFFIKGLMFENSSH